MAMHIAQESEPSSTSRGKPGVGVADGVAVAVEDGEPGASPRYRPAPANTKTTASNNGDK